MQLTPIGKSVRFRNTVAETGSRTPDIADTMWLGSCSPLLLSASTFLAGSYLHGRILPFQVNSVGVALLLADIGSFLPNPLVC